MEDYFDKQCNEILNICYHTNQYQQLLPAEITSKALKSISFPCLYILQQLILVTLELCRQTYNLTLSTLHRPAPSRQLQNSAILYNHQSSFIIQGSGFSEFSNFLTKISAAVKNCIVKLSAGSNLVFSSAICKSDLF